MMRGRRIASFKRSLQRENVNLQRRSKFSYEKYFLISSHLRKKYPPLRDVKSFSRKKKRIRDLSKFHALKWNQINRHMIIFLFLWSYVSLNCQKFFIVIGAVMLFAIYICINKLLHKFWKWFFFIVHSVN